MSGWRRPRRDPGDPGAVPLAKGGTSARSLAWLFRRIGPVLAIAAARAVTAGQGPYAATHAVGVAEWGSQRL